MFSRKKAPGPSPNRRPLVLVVALTAAFTALTAIALAPSTPLEVDGNAIDNAGGGEDWDVNLPVLKRDHVTGESGAEDAYVQGGSKDERDISSAGVTSQYWRYGNAQVPDKDDLVHAFAKEYVVNGDKLLYFGATRASNDGDSSIGFWFLKKAISLGTAMGCKLRHRFRVPPTPAFRRAWRSVRCGFRCRRWRRTWRRQH